LTQFGREKRYLIDDGQVIQVSVYLVKVQAIAHHESDGIMEGE